MRHYTARAPTDQSSIYDNFLAPWFAHDPHKIERKEHLIRQKRNTAHAPVKNSSQAPHHKKYHNSPSDKERRTESALKIIQRLGQNIVSGFFKRLLRLNGITQTSADVRNKRIRLFANEFLPLRRSEGTIGG